MAEHDWTLSHLYLILLGVVLGVILATGWFEDEILTGMEIKTLRERDEWYDLVTDCAKQAGEPSSRPTPHRSETGAPADWFE